MREFVVLLVIVLLCRYLLIKRVEELKSKQHTFKEMIR